MRLSGLRVIIARCIWTWDIYMTTDHKTTALVTGASSGIGREFCRQLSTRCEVIIAVARSADALDGLQAELTGQVEVHAIVADLATVEGLSRCFEALRQQGPVDILVNNAGFGLPGHLTDQAPAAQRQMIELHQQAVVSLCRAAVPFMAELGGGQIINVSSLGAFLPGRTLALYGATKSFLNYFSLCLAEEVARDGIKVQALCPGYTRTGFHSTPALVDTDMSKIPAAMWMDGEAVVTACLTALAAPDSPVILVPGDDNLALARAGLQAQLDALGA